MTMTMDMWEKSYTKSQNKKMQKQINFHYTKENFTSRREREQADNHFDNRTTERGLIGGD